MMFRLHFILLIVCGCVVSPVSAQTVTNVQILPFNNVEKTNFLKAHNLARKAVGVEPLEWSDDLSAYSAEWLTEQAPELKLAALKGLPVPKHRPQAGKFAQKHGENWATWGGTARGVKSNPARAMTIWMSEKADFDKLNRQKPFVIGDENAGNKPVVVGHYTQIVWNGTRLMGASRLIIETTSDIGPMRYVIVFSNYDPPGNSTGKAPY